MTGNHVCSAWLVLWGRPKLIFLLINLSKQEMVKNMSVAALELLLEKDEGGGPGCPPAPGEARECSCSDDQARRADSVVTLQVLLTGKLQAPGDPGPSADRSRPGRRLPRRDAATLGCSGD